MPMIRYIAPDPRAGRTVRLTKELADRLIEGGRAEEISEDEAAEAESEAAAAAAPPPPPPPPPPRGKAAKRR